MINNDVSNHLSRYFANRAGQNDAGGAAEMYKKIKARHDAIHGRGESAEKAAEAQDADKTAKGAEANAAAAADAKGKNKGKAKTESDNLSPEERRQKELKAILDKINAEDEARYGKTTKTDETKTNEAKKAAESGVINPESEEAKKDPGFLSFLNDMPLFNEFKAGLMDAFKRLDSATAGSISAQYELNYTTMQYVANEAGGFDYKETSFNIKLDLSYVKAAGGKGGTEDIQKLLGSATDFSSLINALGSGQKAQAAAPNPNDAMANLKDYFSPEKTADRIVDFATAFFPNSDAFKAKGDTEEARSEFADVMRKAIQKGFDQAMGTLGKVPQSVQNDIDKTHELTFKGIDDFVKNGMNRKKEQDGVYSALEELFFSAQVSYTERTVSVRSTQGSYGRNGEQAQTSPAPSAFDTQA